MSDERFKFGKNWQNFLSTLDEDRIQRAEASLIRLLGKNRFDGLSFLDIGSGSGLFSLAARRLGANVRSFDYDLQSVECTKTLRAKYFPEDAHWEVGQGSVLDQAFLQTLGKFDIVYSWGVLHHTGSMWQALSNVQPLVKPEGLLCVALYNDQGRISQIWTAIKRLFVNSNKLVQFLLVLLLGIGMEGAAALIRLLTLRNPLPFSRWSALKRERGMSPWYDLVDWVGGYPFEVAKPEEVFLFYKKAGFQLQNMTTRGGSQGCNEFVFIK